MGVERGAIKVEGLKAVNSSLQALGEDKATLSAANLEAAETLIRKANPLVPVRTGALKQSLKASRTQTSAAVRGGSAKVPYAGPIHWGWFYDQKNGKPKHIRPQPFLSNALKLSYAEIMSQYQRNMEALIKKHNL